MRSLLRTLLLCAFAGTVMAQATLDDALVDLAKEVNKNVIKHRKSRLAVIDFAELDGTANHLGRRFAEALLPKLQNARAAFAGSDPKEFQLDPSAIKKLALFTGADALLTGSFRESRGLVSVNYRLLDGATGKMLWASSSFVTKNQLLSLLDTPTTIDEDQAAEIARRLTSAIVDDDVRSIDNLIGREVREQASAIHQSAFRYIAGYDIRVLKVSERKVTQLGAHVTCDDGKAAFVSAFISADNGRLVRFAMTDGAAIAGKKVTAAQKALASTEFATYLSELERASQSDMPRIPSIPITASAVRSAACRNARVINFERMSDIDDVIAVFVVIEAIGRTIPVRVDVFNSGKISSWEMLEATDFPDQQSPMRSDPKLTAQTQVEPPPSRKNVVRSTLKRRLYSVRTSGNAAFSELVRYNIGGEEYHFADGALATIDRITGLTVAAFSEPELEPLRRWVADTFTTARPSVVEKTLTVDGREMVYRLLPVKAVNTFKSRWEETVARIEAFQDIAPDVRMTSIPTDAPFSLYMKDDATAIHTGTTERLVANVYRGVYDLVVEKPGHKPARATVDLVNDPPTAINCRLVLKLSQEESVCHQQQ